MFSPRGFYAISTLVAAMTASALPPQSPCDALKGAGLQDPILLPGDEAYTARIDSLWSASARVAPACIVTPKDAAEVSKVLGTLQKFPLAKFAIRGRGHSHWGGSNVEGGVEIDLGVHFVGATYDPSTKLASVLPASRWGEVLRELDTNHGVGVVSGREGNVGVGGFLTGGGNSWHTGRHGFACDNIANAQVVLADGRMVNANKDENADLFKALKGGWGNFGIVTRFDLYTHPSVPAWGGLRVSPYSEGPLVAQAVVNFTTNTAKHPGSSYLVNWSYDLNVNPEPFTAQFLIDTDGVVEAPAFAEALKVGEYFNDFSMRPMHQLVDDYRTSGGRRQVWFTLTVGNDIRIVNKAVDLTTNLINELLKVIPGKDLTVQGTFQPMPKVFFDIGKAKGGNVMGMDRYEEDSLQWALISSVRTPEQEKILHDLSLKFTDELREYAVSLNSLRDWLYINYADPAQDAISSYGPENVAFLKQVSAKYDPAGFFQKQAVGMKLPA
ncbi:hypothetical protein PpBr36_06834 [Pyricularia pennisetigena]|uniref:hypothetical protein n=1 Tax=Pyricularia pennisetigena TaxID=1578925 RepID=UPI00114E0224|nr:hypothetical protein PpBr36_06834 [Pyricularia pennisetigena]TLS25296.1 hypothetical protein PpBr36_06834 [Pyricularia pennisetigena]